MSKADPEDSSRPNRASLRSRLSGSVDRVALQLTEDHLVSVLLVRRGREAVFGPGLFSDPAWDILLELYAAALGQRSMSGSDLATAIGAPLSTTARWISALTGRGLVVLNTDPDSSDDPMVDLTAKGAEKLKKLGDQWGSAFVSF